MSRKSNPASGNAIASTEPETTPDISEVILRLKPKLIKPIHGSPLIEIPIGDAPGIPKELHPIRSEESRGEISFLIQREHGRTPSREETTRLILFLMGLANRTPVQKQSFEEVAAHSPLVEALMIFLRSEANGFFQGTATQLIDQLAQIGYSEHLHSQESGWSKHPNEFGKQLENISQMLPEFGIEFKRDRTSARRVITLTLMTGDDSRMTGATSFESTDETTQGEQHDSNDSFDPTTFQHLEINKGTE